MGHELLLSKLVENKSQMILRVVPSERFDEQGWDSDCSFFLLGTKNHPGPRSSFVDDQLRRQIFGMTILQRGSLWASSNNAWVSKCPGTSPRSGLLAGPIKSHSEFFKERSDPPTFFLCNEP